MEPPQEIVSMMSLDFLEKHKEQSALDSAESDDESFGFHLLQPQPLRKDFSKHQFNANMDSGGYSKNRGYTFIDPEVQNLNEMSFGASSSNAPGKNGRFSRYSTVEETLLHYNQGKKIIYAAKNGSFTEQNRRAMIRILIDELTFVHDSCYPPTESKVALAKAIVTEFPLLKNAHSKLGYEHYYDTQSKVGFIEYRLFTVRKSLPPDKKRYHSARKDVASSVFGSILLTEDDLNDKIMWMMNSNATNMNKVYISNCLRETFPNRRAWISRERPEISEILGKYPRLFNYNGDMINEEFKLMFPKHEDNFRTQFNPFYTSRIVEYAKIYKFDCLKNKCDIEDSVLKSLLLLMDLLPVANSVKGKVKESEKRRHTNFPVCPAAFIEIVPEGTNVEQFIANKRRADCIASQPYLICVKGQPMQYFIQGDGWILHHDDTTSLIQTFDLFFKLTHVCNLEYSPVLQNFFSFVENFFYKINNNAKSLVTSLFINLCNIKFEN